MAEKRRGLGRGLSALIPETQAEPGGRPSDVFFPGSTAAAKPGASSPERATRSEDITAALLSPAPRKRGGRAGGGGSAVQRGPSGPVRRSGSGRREPTTGVPAAPASQDAEEVNSIDGVVSRETSPASHAGTATEPEASAVATASERSILADGEPALVEVPGTTFGELPIAAIIANRRQPRQVFDEEDISELADSIREVGLLQPVVVRRIADDVVDAQSVVTAGEREATGTTVPQYELVMGERRLRAAREAGLATVPALVRQTEDEDLLRDALLENLHRVQLNPLEEAAAYQQLLEDFGCTHAELSTRIARSRSQISNTLRLMKLPPLVQRRLAAGVVSAGHARALLGLPDTASMERLAQRIVAEGLSVRATEELVALHDEPADRGTQTLRARSTPLPALSTRLSDAFETRVKVTRGAKKGRITIEFAGEDDLARIVGALAPGVSVSED